MIVKHMHGPYNELATKGLERIIIKKINEGGQGPKILPIGSTLYQGNVNQKEADASFKATQRSSKQDRLAVCRSGV